jgi:HEAT repeat protein
VIKVRFAFILLAMVSLSACMSMLNDDPVKDKAEHDAVVAKTVKILHEPMHTGFFGTAAEAKRVEAAWDLGHDLEATGAVPDLAQALSDPNPEVRTNAAASLWNMADHATLAVPALKQTLNDQAPRARLNAVRALSAMKAMSGTELLPVLFGIAESPNLYDAVFAADLATTLGAKPHDVEPILMRGIDDREVGETLLDNLAKQQEDVAYLPLLTVGGQKADVAIRARSVKMLGGLSYQNPNTQALLMAATNDDSVDVRANAATALVAGGYGLQVGKVLGPGLSVENPSIARLVALMRDQDPEVRAAAAESLGNARAEGPPVIDGLVTAVTDVDWSVRYKAVNALGWIGPKAKSAVPALLAIYNANKNTTQFKDEAGAIDSDFATEVYETLAELGAEPIEAKKMP